MDYLHYMQLEQENFNLIGGPILADIVSFALNERVDGGLVDFSSISISIAIRFLLLFGFLYNLTFSTKGHAKYWKGFYMFIIGMYVVNLIMFIILSIQEADKDVRPKAIRRATN